MYVGLHVKYPLFLSEFNEILIILTDVRKILKYQILKNPSSRRQVVSCGLADRWTGSQPDATKLTVPSSNFVDSPKNHYITMNHCL